ncbi:uncharacterized protein K452DRAFT_221021 [Aplosporella prunicola CBS 121167]|uniref:Alpha/beta hydrolase fold-3 domain-containing protein n=1 Tax=Aplosporella prunicola CBS 121167 TaxID=1176127 RepID=A0A6A6BTB7_9PEZI|nr:uncharacterized protein K452DRAFT_221021 [Aplosporella prunicola CBS 121167]KAF2145861.1 hypothetical protein K452DRAFT_221021 [Aplosporella prunicola CBS 121167]
MENVEKSIIQIPVRDGSTIPALLYQPIAAPKGGSPLLVCYHGGGWCLGTPETDELSCVNAVQHFGAVCLSVDYRVAPEHPFPTPINDSWDALEWIANNSSQLRASPSQGFLVHGESAGANIAIVIALLARDRKLNPPITGVSASAPVVLSPEMVPDKYKAEYQSRTQNNDAPVLSGNYLSYLVGHYKPDQNSPLFNCFNWPTGHHGLPPIHFQICGLDPLRDEGLLYEKVLRTEYNVRTKLTIYPGLPHTFWYFFPDLEVSKTVAGNTTAGFEWMLNGVKLRK